MPRPAGFKPFYKSSQGVDWYRRNNGDGTVDYAFDEDVESILDQNKAMANHNDGWMSEKWGRRRATIPLTLWMKWLNEEGWDAFAPENADRLMKRLRDPDYRFLLTADYAH
ncbi:MAG: hypothetical protein AAGK02_04680 [Pseudomonadota bacterium]